MCLEIVYHHEAVASRYRSTDDDAVSPSADDDALHQLINNHIKRFFKDWLHIINHVVVFRIYKRSYLMGQGYYNAIKNPLCKVKCF